MKKILPLFILCSLLHICHSQITITQSDMPNGGDTLRVSYSLDTLDPTLTGTNYTWDYSYLTANAQWVHKFESPASFVFPFNLLFNVLNTSYGQGQYTPDSLPMLGLKPDNAYAFFKESSTRYKQIGAGLTINALPIPFFYNPHDTIYRLPLNYGNMDSSDAEFGFNIPGMGYYGRKTHRVNVADGWGTLITPYGTFPALRVKSMLSVRDTFADTSGVMGFAFNRPLVHEYKWLTSGGKIPYLEVNATTIAGFPVVNQISYRDSMQGGAIQIGIHGPVNPDFGLQVFPNPVADYIVLEYTLDHSRDVRIELMDISGKKICSLMNAKQLSGTHLEIINLRNFNVQNGAYLLSFSAEEEKAVRKIIVH